MCTNFCINKFRSFLRKNSWKIAFLGLLTVYNHLSNYWKLVIRKFKLLRSLVDSFRKTIVCWDTKKTIQNDRKKKKYSETDPISPGLRHQRIKKNNIHIYIYIYISVGILSPTPIQGFETLAGKAHLVSEKENVVLRMLVNAVKFRITDVVVDGMGLALRRSVRSKVKARDIRWLRAA